MNSVYYTNLPSSHTSYIYIALVTLFKEWVANSALPSLSSSSSAIGIKQWLGLFQPQLTENKHLSLQPLFGCPILLCPFSLYSSSYLGMVQWSILWQCCNQLTWDCFMISNVLVIHTACERAGYISCNCLRNLILAAFVACF